MKRRNNEQPIDKKPVVANFKLWRELTESSQATVCGGTVANNLTGTGEGDDEVI